MTTKTTKSPRTRKSSKLEAPTPAKKTASAVSKCVTKQAQLIELLQQENGATTVELASALSWLPHTTRAALTGLRKKGHAVILEKVNGQTRYRVETAA
jgi:DNA-binding MarR family transcriptional regulator